MEKFAGYGFNKSHAAAYALVAYHTAWLKAHYPAEFMAAVMSSEMQNTDSVVFLIDDCRNNGLEVLPPSVNMSTYHFHASDDKTIVYGLGQLKVLVNRQCSLLLTHVANKDLILTYLISAIVLI